jgi:hypothetical protein
MTLADLIAAPPSPADLRGLWLVFDANLAAAALAKQADHAQHRIAPVPGPDGRFALCADLLTECAPGGLYHPTFAALDAARFGEVEIVSTDSLRASGWFAAASEV